MEILKNLSFTAILILVGAIFLFFGLIGSCSIGGNDFGINEAWVRVLAIIIGVVLIVFSVFLEIKSKVRFRKILVNRNKVSLQPISHTVEKVYAENFFYVLDDEPSENFPALVKDASRVSILGRTTVNLLSQYKKVFEEMGNSGCEIRLLFVDPSSDASKFLYGSNSEVYLNNIKTSVFHLKDLKNKIKLHFDVRVTKHAPTFSIIIVEKRENSQSFIRGQLYFLHSCVGRDRPIFRISHDDKWYNIFNREFNQLWIDGTDWNESCLKEIIL